MSKKNKRPLSKTKQKELLRRQLKGVKPSEINKLSNTDLEKAYKAIISDNQRKAEKIIKPEAVRKRDLDKRKAQRKERISKKRWRLNELGYKDATDSRLYSDSQVDSIPWRVLNEGRQVNAEKYPWLKTAGFDFDKIYKLPNGQRIYFAFRDYQGELDIATEIERFKKYNVGALIEGLEAIVNQEPTYKRGQSGSSSGRAGEGKVLVGSQSAINEMAYDENRQNTKARTLLKNQRKLEAGGFSKLSPKQRARVKHRHYSGDVVQWQHFSPSHASNSFSEITGRNLLIMANAICYNVTEQNRISVYSDLYRGVVDVLPEFAEWLPKPRF